MDTLTITLPGLRLWSEMNCRDHWRARKRRFDDQRIIVRCLWPRPLCRDYGERLAVTITRYGPRRLDSDNLASSAKAVRDEIAHILGIDDGSDRIEWRYAQEEGAYGVRITIEPRD